LWKPPIDTFQQHRQLCGRQRYLAFFGGWPHEPALLKPLAEQARTLAIPPDDLDQIAASTTKDEQMPTRWPRPSACFSGRRMAQRDTRARRLRLRWPQRLDTFKFVYTAALRASEALLPYGLAKVTPDAGSTQIVQMVVAGGSRPQPSPDTARDVTPKARGVASPPMPNEM
jgi:hypothetical protein